MQQPGSGEVVAPSIRIDGQSYPVLNRWLSLSSNDFKQELDLLANLGRDASLDPVTQKAVQSAVTTLARLYRHRSVMMSDEAKRSNLPLR